MEVFTAPAIANSYLIGIRISVVKKSTRIRQQLCHASRNDAATSAADHLNQSRQPERSGIIPEVTYRGSERRARTGRARVPVVPTSACTDNRELRERQTLALKQS